MANKEQLEILKQGVEVWNKWRIEEGLFVQIDLSGANLRDADLQYADLRDADLSHADLRDAMLMEAFLAKTDLRKARLIKAHLHIANFMEADLRNADLREARFHAANLSRANLSGANLSHAVIGNTTFGDNDLRNIVGIGTVKHYYPSQISTGTLKLSEGKIPDDFLRGCGLSDWKIESLDRTSA